MPAVKYDATRRASALSPFLKKHIADVDEDMFPSQNATFTKHLCTNNARRKIYKFFLSELACFCNTLILNVFFSAIGLGILLKPASLLAPQPVK
jgi:hypothetical protein